MDTSDAGSADFTAGYRTIAPALRAWASLQARSRLFGAVEADDLVQEVCFQAYRSYASFDPSRGSFRAWVFGIANHVLLMLQRQLARAHARGGPVETLASRAGEIPEEATTISRRVARDEGLATFVERIAALDEQDHRLLLYRGLEGLRHDEVGRLLGLSADGVRKRWQRLRAQLLTLPVVEGLLEDS